MGLVDKFKNVKVNPKDKMSNEDMAYCDRITREANPVVEQLRKVYAKNLELFEAEDLGFEIDANGDVVRGSKREIDMDGFERYEWSYGQNLKSIKSEMDSVINRYLYKIISYFESKYKLQLSDVYGGRYNQYEFRENFPEKEYFSDLDYAEIIDKISTFTNGADLVKMGEDKFKAEFIRGFKNWGSKTFEIKGNTLRVDGYLTLYPKSYGTQYEYDDSKIGDLHIGLNFFETGALSGEIDKTFKDLKGKACYFDEITFYNFKMIKSFKLFKNGRMDLKFTSPKFANDFSIFYGLDQL